MLYRYRTHGTCSRTIDIDLDDNGTVVDARFEGGCEGNLKGMRELVRGRDARELISMLEGISCSGRPTSCPDQLARALKALLEQEKP